MRRVIRKTGWRSPVEVAATWADEPYAFVLLDESGWSYFGRAPDAMLTVESGDETDAVAALTALLGPEPRELVAGEPPFQGGVVGLAAYEFGARLEPAMPQARSPGWPDMVAARYPAILAFDHRAAVVWAFGHGETEEKAATLAEGARDWLDPPSPPSRADRLAENFASADPPQAYRAAVADVIRRIHAGEIYQANVARRWTGRLAPQESPFDVFARLAHRSPAPYAAFLQLPGQAIVSNSPEAFIGVKRCDDRLIAHTKPIKGTRPRGATPAADATLAAELLASEKDRAENLMIVDLMRNDLSKLCPPGEVTTPGLFAVESFVNVHHLVSTVRGRLEPGRSAIDLFASAFPPGSITGAPKIQAMTVIASHELPRGPFFGSIFWADFGGGFGSSVLIRTAAFEETASGWNFEARAGAGIVADSDPAAECEETEVKIAALRRALTEPL